MLTLVRFVPNIFADEYGAMTCQIPNIIISTGLVFTLLGIKTQSGVIAFCLLYGFFSGALISLYPPIAAAFADSMAEVGIRMGVTFFSFAVACLAGSPIVGALIGYGPYAWWKGIVFSGVRSVAYSPPHACDLLVAGRWGYQKKGLTWV
ncbi:hypothetical protein DACRYDRAFT_53738 [Dacryopinax primogenitus]|uniref:Major facilitator superfamily (MFS) profile domain-containing protein n=1 Tax=Dacryopinax primogenitus (strain DJM 731) TaxID=1858805 RepID=M5FTR5_DACPD|nr:uncharacterized protein DACRYDRAFT_53738 [Dacryopinax primogenitus]EJU01046.1 hypothetical protein DACRYDRAFT_53738 [Dacryopinax primogenitus]